MEKLNSLKFWVSPRLIPTTEDAIARSKRDRHSFHNDSFLNSRIEVQVIQQGQKRNTGRTHSPNSAHRKIDKLDFIVRERERSYIQELCLVALRSLLFCMLVSKPTVSSSI